MFLRFRVVATPVPKGSARAFIAGGRAIVTSDARNLKGWEYLIRSQAARVVLVTTAEPIRIAVDFYLPRPKSHPKRREIPHTKKPDLDKLARAVLDALTGVVYDDDAQVVALRCTKRHATLGEQPGCHITITAQAWPPSPTRGVVEEIT